jgi:N-acetylglucosaminyldiphosphoundecaprenol N-acetyl-beta-D-mannosaminyltransferase
MQTEALPEARPALARPQAVEILGVRVHALDAAGLLGRAVGWAAGREPKQILYVNAHCLNLACADPEYRAVLNRADLVYTDGISVVWAGRLLDGARMQKITGADWIEALCARAQECGLRLYILAGRPGIARRAAERLQDRWPALQIAGASDGYFEGLDEAAALADIRRARPHILFVGLGSPRQEKWLAAHRHELEVPVCWAVGALFDYVAGMEPRAPRWMSALALEWLWRLQIDPLGKWRRYLIGNPLFVLRLLRQKLMR